MDNSAFINNLKELFDECDIDQNGFLTRIEFSELCAKIGLNKQTSEETFNRLDTDKNESITFEEFIAGFNQYKQTAQIATTTTPEEPITSDGTINVDISESNHKSDSSRARSQSQLLAVPSQSNQRSRSISPVETHSTPGPSIESPRRNHQRLSPVTSRASRSGANTIGFMSIGSNGSSQVTSRFGSGSGDASGSGEFNSLGNMSSGSGFVPTAYRIGGSSASRDGGQLQNSNSTSNINNVVVYSSDLLTGNESTSQMNSLMSNNSSLHNNNQSTLSMQDLLDCVQKLQEENQILSQIFFKDKREREEYINQLGEEFDQQVKAVEERANKRAKEELENEKRRLRDMMKTERETLEHHYQTIERMGKIIKSTSEDKNRLEDGDIDKVRSRLEDTYQENRQLKKSLLDTKTDVALIWREMEKLKRQYEEKLSNAYERNQQTKSECDHIKQQLNLMKDSNRKLQDASDVITNYIADKVEPVIKIANGENSDQEHISLPNQCKLISSQCNSRRGSVLSDYLGNDEISELSLEIAGTSTQRNRDQCHSQNQKQPCSLNSVELESLTNQGSRASETPSDGKSWLSLPLDKIKRSKSQQKLESVATSESSNSQLEQTNSISGFRNALSRKFFSPSSLPKSTNQSQSIDIKDPPEAQIAKHQANLTKSMSVQTDADSGLIGPADGPSVATYDLILVGDSFVGKSSLASRFIEGSYVKGIISTTSIDFKTKDCKVDGVNYTINLWDTAGQERFRSITASYFRKAKGIILMYDVTEKHTYLNVRNWMNTISNSASESVAVLLLGNKIDLRTDNNKTECIPFEEGLRLANEYGIIFLETSVKSGINLDIAMGQLIRQIVKNSTPVEDDSDRIKLHGKNRSYACMPKNC